MTKQSAILRVRDAADVVGIVPYLLGFQPRDSVVAVVIVDGQVIVCARFDVSLCLSPPGLTARLGPVLAQFPTSEIIVAGYGADRERITRAAEAMTERLGEHWVDTVIVVGDRYWTYDELADAGCPGTVYDLTSGPLATRAICAGLSVLADRSEVSRLLEAPEGEALVEARRIRTGLAERWSSEGVADRVTSAESLFGKPEPTTEQLIELGLLIGDHRVRDELWLALTRATAQTGVGRWSAVVRALPPEDSLPALCLAGIAAWLSGNGALLVDCLDRGLQICPSYSMLSILDDINSSVAPPATWDRIRAQLLAERFEPGERDEATG